MRQPVTLDIIVPLRSRARQRRKIPVKLIVMPLTSLSPPHPLHTTHYHTHCCHNQCPPISIFLLIFGMIFWFHTADPPLLPPPLPALPPPPLPFLAPSFSCFVLPQYCLPHPPLLFLFLLLFNAAVAELRSRPLSIFTQPFRRSQKIKNVVIRDLLGKGSAYSRALLPPLSFSSSSRSFSSSSCAPPGAGVGVFVESECENSGS